MRGRRREFEIADAPAGGTPEAGVAGGDDPAEEENLIWYARAIVENARKAEEAQAKGDNWNASHYTENVMRIGYEWNWMVRHRDAEALPDSKFEPAVYHASIDEVIGPNGKMTSSADSVERTGDVDPNVPDPDFKKNKTQATRSVAPASFDTEAHIERLEEKLDRVLQAVEGRQSPPSSLDPIPGSRR